ncbi:MAG: 2-oxoglutarate and iron-dependent oxygenase domain-containing protein [Actinomycetota bacterium]
MTTLPTFDISTVMGGEAPSSELSAGVDRACTEIGFFGVTGHGISAEQRGAVLDAARTFFSLPEAAKAAVAIEKSPNNRGWGSMGAEHLQPDIPTDLKETFDIAIERSADDPRNSPLDGPNLWPELEGFRETLEDFQDVTLQVAHAVLRVMGAALDLDADFFESRLRRPLVETRLLHYPGVEELPSDGQLGAGAHSDYGCVTLLYSDGTPGLQLQNADGEWIDAVVPADALVVNLGDLMQRWTNDRYRSTVHRVLPPVGTDRYSVPVFVTGDWDAVVETLPSCITDDAPKQYETVLAGEYLQRRFDETFAYRAAD